MLIFKVAYIWPFIPFRNNRPTSGRMLP